MYPLTYVTIEDRDLIARSDTPQDAMSLAHIKTKR